MTTGHDTTPGAAHTSEDLSAGLAEQARLIQWHVGVWHDLGYQNPPSPDCHPVPPLGERPAAAITAGHQAVEDIDQMIRQLHALRGQLAAELRQDSDIRGARIDAQIAQWDARPSRMCACAHHQASHRDGGACLAPGCGCARFTARSGGAR